MRERADEPLNSNENLRQVKAVNVVGHQLSVLCALDPIYLCPFESVWYVHSAISLLRAPITPDSMLLHIV